MFFHYEPNLEKQIYNWKPSLKKGGSILFQQTVLQIILSQTDTTWMESINEAKQITLYQPEFRKAS